MFFNDSVRSGQNATALEALHARLIEESLLLQDCLKIVEKAEAVAGVGAEAESARRLMIRKQTVELTNPRDLFVLNGSDKLDVKQKSNDTRFKARFIAEILQHIFERVSIGDLSIFSVGLTNSSLYKNIAYYRMSLQIAARYIEKYFEQSKSVESNVTLKRCLNDIRFICEGLNRVPASTVERFDEQHYLQSNVDVQEAVAKGDIFCGLEHFAIQGMQEIVAGSRSASLQENDLAISISCNKSGASGLRDIMSTIEASGVFDAKWYKRTYGVKINALAHYCKVGYKQNNAPNAHFDTAWYLENNPTLDVRVINPAYHYVIYGENQGRMPAEYFDPLWYKSEYGVSEGLALTHYMRVGISKGFNPNRFIDRAYYLEKNEDVAIAKLDAIEHYYAYGWKEGRNPSATFDASSYAANNMNEAMRINPVTHALLELLTTEGVASNSIPDADFSKSKPASVELGDIASNIKYFANPGADFENGNGVNCSALTTRAKTVAFYLPQFHSFEENDKWWGAGFTEWRNVTRGTPRFSGHYQPRIPRDLGFYDLNNEQVIVDQSKMALANGIEAFCFYYYWFNGQRLMDMPLDSFAGSSKIDQEFCIMWANENWTRTWDGFDSEVLMEQNYRDEDEQAFLEDTAHYFQHERYMRVDGRPLFILYRPGLLPNAIETIERWRLTWEKMLGVEPHILMVQGFGDNDPAKFGLDGAVEFPPHKVCSGVMEVQDKLTILDPNYSGTVLNYEDVIGSSLSESKPEYPLVKTVVPHWDNDARREGRGYTLHGSTPKLYEKWLNGAISFAEENPFEGQPLVFINAWNEWAEGAYLEPDVHYGHAYLNSTKRAVYGLKSNISTQKLLLVGHDAYKHGAQMLLLSMAEIYKRQFGMHVTILLKDGGPLLEKYKNICNTVVLSDLVSNGLTDWLKENNFDIAICNTSVTGDLLPELKKVGIKSVSLIHELPNLIEEYKLESNLQCIASSASHVVFPSNIVLNGFSQFVNGIDAEQVINPQGTYKKIEYDAEKRSSLRRELGIGIDEKIVLNVGYGDLRKGFDLFLHISRRVISERSDVHFVWVGEVSADMKRWIESDLDSNMRKNINLVGFTNEMSDYYSASDCFFLTSREDPYPTVVLEAMDVGLPVVLYKDATGFDSLISEYGQVVDKNNTEETILALVDVLYKDTENEKQDRRDYVREYCQFDDYCFSLLKMLLPSIKKVSVVVPNYNYEEYLQDRLKTIFNQTYPVFETIVLDDCSNDNSLEVIKQVADSADRIVKIHVNKKNSGNVFKQWGKGIAESRGELLWIAEADDLATEKFLTDSVAAMSEKTALAFTNSSQIGPSGEVLAGSYDYYYDTINKSLFSKSFEMKGNDFIKEAMSLKNTILNVSSVVWDKSALHEALEAVGDELTTYNLAGDWRLYLEVMTNPELTICYLSDSLNIHRRHDDSVTHSLDCERHLFEIKTIHDQVKKIIKTDTEYEAASEKYMSELSVQFGLIKKSKAA